MPAAAGASDISAAVRIGLRERGSLDAIAFAGRWRPWSWLHASAEALQAIVVECGLNQHSAAALVARTRPQHVAALAAQIAAHRPTRMVYSMQSAAAIAADVESLGAPLVLADEEDWTAELQEAVRRTGGVGVILRDAEEGAFALHPDLRRAPATRSPAQSAAFELLSSGTTGPPKRVSLEWSAVEQSVADARLAYVGTDHRSAPLLMLHPLGNIAGLGYLAPALVNGQRIVLLEKFTVDGWAEAVRRYRPVRCALPPPAMRMVLEAGVPRSALESLQVVAVGGARLETDVHERFEETYGIPVLTAYGATEFGGVIAHWTLPLYEKFGKAKRGSVGKASANVSLRIVDPLTLKELPCGDVGLLEAWVPRIGARWLRTTDLARIDTDGFLFLEGRADAAINRGGFKIVPDAVAEVLRAHPAVADAAVVGMPDARLGEVPVAAIELKSDAPGDALGSIARFAREQLLTYQVPVDWRIVPALPRNASLKVSIPEVRALFIPGPPP
jgi:acyl-coenzyme A synthetase/AMP-(fatty) acid ligase